MYGSCVGWQVELCDPLVTHGPYLSTSEIRSLHIKRNVNSAVNFTSLYSAVIFSWSFSSPTFSAN